MSSIEKAIARLEVNPSPISREDDGALPLPINLSKPTANSEQQLAANKPYLELHFDSLAAQGFLTPNAIQGTLAEEYRLIKRTLTLNANNVPKSDFLGYGNPLSGNLVAVTSALRGEGKTFTAFNLAMSFAMGWDTSALLVDCNAGEQSITNLVGLNNAPGLTDVLLNPAADLQNVIYQTNVPRLMIIPAGRSHSDTTELLASDRMQELVNSLSSGNNNRIVLFDTSPLLIGSQALILTSMIGQILVVVREGKTSQKAIKEAVSLLDETKTVGMVLNGCYHSSSIKYH